MVLAPWKSFRELSPFRKEMEDMWDLFQKPFMSRFFEREWLPTSDMVETKDNIIIKVELPGMDKKDLSVTLSDDLLMIKGEKKTEKEESDEFHHSVERYQGSFQRSFRLPVSVKSDKIEATFEKGVLKITLPKTEEAKKKAIEIKVKES